MSNIEQLEKVAKGNGFIAALDQSGGSTPKALRQYGVEETAYTNDVEMFDLIHAMRSRIMTSPAFTGDKVVGAILFEQTMDREVLGKQTAHYLWEEKAVVPFLKIDKGLEDAQDDVQLMKPIAGLDHTLARAKELGIFGTKERSVIGGANRSGIAKIVAQQFELGGQVLSHGLMPILEPEVTITIKDKLETETILREELLAQLEQLPNDQKVMLKLSLPSAANHYADVIAHPKVLKVVALSGGYNRDDANELLAQNTGMIASFSRALAEGLFAGLSDAEFDAILTATVNKIHAASIAG